MARFRQLGFSKIIDGILAMAIMLKCQIPSNFSPKARATMYIAQLLYHLSNIRKTFLFAAAFYSIIFFSPFPTVPAYAQTTELNQVENRCSDLHALFQSFSALPRTADQPNRPYFLHRLCTAGDLVLADNCNTENSHTWPARQTITAHDLATLLTNPEISESLDLNFLEIRCARITGELDLSTQILKDRLMIVDSVFTNFINLNYSRFEYTLVFSNSHFYMGLQGAQFHVNGDLILSGSKFDAPVETARSNISGNVVANNAVFHQTFENAEIQAFEGEGLYVGGDLILDGASAFSVDLNRSQIGGNLSANGAKFFSKFLISNAEVQGGLYASEGAVFHGQLNLLKTSIDSDFSTLGSTFCHEINGYALRVGGDLILGASVEPSRPAEIARLILINATIARNVKIGYAHLGRAGASDLDRRLRQIRISPGDAYFSPCNDERVNGGHEFRGMSVGENIDFSNGRFVGFMDFMSAKIDGSVFGAKARFSDTLWLENAQIGGSIRFNEASFASNLVLRGASIAKDAEFLRGGIQKLALQGAFLGSNLDVRGRVFLDSLDLDGARITGDLILGTSENGIAFNAMWGGHGDLLARNLNVRGIQDSQALWEGVMAPKELDLVGFSYSRFVGANGNTDRPIPARDTKWFKVHWFDKQIGHNEEVAAGLYGQLVDALRANGFDEQANNLIVERYDSIGPQEDGLLSRVSHVVSGYLDYGNAPGKGLLAFCLPVVVGFGLFFLFERPAERRAGWTIGDSLFFTVDALLPAVSLQKAYDEYQFQSWVKYYFYFLKFSGYVFLFLFIRWINGIYTYFPLFNE